MTQLLSTCLSTSTLHLQPGQEPQGFEVTVNNHSREFATFQLELLAAGVESTAAPAWYGLTPDLSAKIPAGDRTQFSVKVWDVPPVPGGFIGTMTVTVRVFSLELRQEDRQVMRLVVAGDRLAPLQLTPASAQFVAVPEQTLEIPIRLQNPNLSLVRAATKLQGLPPEWLPEGQERHLVLDPAGEGLAMFLCRVPAAIAAPAQVYPFEIEASIGPGAAARSHGTLTVLPAGQVEFTVLNSPQTLPSADPDPTTALYSLQFNNQSNLTQPVSLSLRRLTWPWYRVQRWSASSALALLKSDRSQMAPQSAILKAGDFTQVDLQLSVRRPWLGWPRQHRFEVQALLADGRVTVQSAAQEIQLRVLPRLRFWLQLMGLGLAAAVLLPILVSRPGHDGPVYAVQINGTAREVVSGSGGQPSVGGLRGFWARLGGQPSLKRWDLRGKQLSPMEQPAAIDKTVRVIRYRPVNNDAIAIGFENGQIELVNLLQSDQRLSLVEQRADRVFDLQFTQDARTLFSGHGSGQVLRWDVADFTVRQSRPIQEKRYSFAVQALALVGSAPDQGERLAIAGRFNQLLLWNWQADQETSLGYPSGGSNDYITSLATAAQRPNMLAVADNQGRLSLWDVSGCVQGRGPCQKQDEWSDGYDGKAVLSVALSADACYLVSGGEDGRVVLWPLNRQGQRQAEPRQLGKANQPINTVDIVERQDRLVVVSGGSDHRVRSYTVPPLTPPCL